MLDIKMRTCRERCVIRLLLLLAGLAVAGSVRDAGRSEDYQWSPELAPSGPIAIVVSIPEQRMYVYRNGVRIGVSAVSTGKPGYETPSGIYAILEKRRDHTSNLYPNGAMPYMQRLTWDGIALHAGGLPGYPASHGCVRLPAAFARKLYDATMTGTIVVVAAADTFPPEVVSPGLFSPIDAGSGAVLEAPPPRTRWSWNPDRSTTGPLTLLLSLSDREIVALRNAVEIGRSQLHAEAEIVAGTHAFMLLEGVGADPSPVLPDRRALRWLSLSGADPAAASSIRQAFEQRRLKIPDEFARLVHEALRPGATVVVTDEPLRRTAADRPVLTSDGPVFPP